MAEAPKIGRNTKQAGNRGKGRPKGSPNKLTRDMKEAIIEAFNNVGGVDYLTKVAQNDERTFCGLLGRVLPMTVDGEVGVTVVHKTVYESKDDHD